MLDWMGRVSEDEPVNTVVWRADINSRRRWLSIAMHSWICFSVRRCLRDRAASVLRSEQS